MDNNGSGTRACIRPLAALAQGVGLAGGSEGVGDLGPIAAGVLGCCQLSAALIIESQLGENGGIVRAPPTALGQREGSAGADIDLFVHCVLLAEVSVVCIIGGEGQGEGGLEAAAETGPSSSVIVRPQWTG